MQMPHRYHSRLSPRNFLYHQEGLFCLFKLQPFKGGGGGGGGGGYLHKPLQMFGPDNGVCYYLALEKKRFMAC